MLLAPSTPVSQPIGLWLRRCNAVAATCAPVAAAAHSVYPVSDSLVAVTALAWLAAVVVAVLLVRRRSITPLAAMAAFSPMVLVLALLVLPGSATVWLLALVFGLPAAPWFTLALLGLLVGAAQRRRGSGSTRPDGTNAA